MGKENTTMKRIKDVLIIFLGWLFIFLGIAGLFLPILQGILFLLIGLFLLSKKSRWARSLLVSLKKRYPQINDRAQENWARIKQYSIRLFRKHS